MFAHDIFQQREKPRTSDLAFPAHERAGVAYQARYGNEDPRENEASNDFEVIVGLFLSNESLFALLNSLDVKLHRAKAYLGEPGCNRSLGVGYVDHLRAKRSWTL